MKEGKLDTRIEAWEDIREIENLMFPWVNENEGFYRKILGNLSREVFCKFEKRMDTKNID